MKKLWDNITLTQIVVTMVVSFVVLTTFMLGPVALFYPLAWASVFGFVYLSGNVIELFTRKP